MRAPIMTLYAWMSSTTTLNTLSFSDLSACVCACARACVSATGSRTA